MMDLKRGSIVLYDGGEIMEDSHVLAKKRPAVIMSNDIGNALSGTVVLVPISRNNRKGITHVTIANDGEPSMCYCEQVRVVSKNDILQVFGFCAEEEMKQIEHCLMVALGISIDRPRQEDNTEIVKELERKLEEATKVIAGYVMKML